jgi:hypothetical protein
MACQKVGGGTIGGFDDVKMEPAMGDDGYPKLLSYDKETVLALSPRRFS